MGDKRRVRKFVDDYCVLRTVTTGFSASNGNDVIEIGLIRVRENQGVFGWAQLIQPPRQLDLLTIVMTGITWNMIQGKPNLDQIEDQVRDFVGDDIIVGYNTATDLALLEKAFSAPLDNQYVDVVEFAQKLYPDLRDYGTMNLLTYLGLPESKFRAISECVATKQVYDTIKRKMNNAHLAPDILWRWDPLDVPDPKKIVSTEKVIRFDNFFFGRHVAFTGNLKGMPLREAMQRTVNVGGVLDSEVGRKTAYLVVGDPEVNPMLRGGKSLSVQLAEERQSLGQKIEIIDEDTFYEYLEKHRPTAWDNKKKSGK